MTSAVEAVVVGRVDSAVNLIGTRIKPYPTGLQNLSSTPKKKEKKEKDEKEEVKSKNDLGFDQDESYLSDLKKYWDYSSLYYYRKTEYGKIGARANRNDRHNGIRATQYQCEAYPILTKRIYLSLAYAWARTSNLIYPNKKYYIEGFYDAPNGVELSFGHMGEKFAAFSGQHIYEYTGSVGRYFGDNFIWFRTAYFKPTKTMFYIAGVRYSFWDDPETYVLLTANAGILPDIGDVPPFDKIIPEKQRGIALGTQLPLGFKKLCTFDKLYIRAGVGYTRQQYPKLLRRVTNFALGLHVYF